MTAVVNVSTYIAALLPAGLAVEAPWQLTSQAPYYIRELLANLPVTEYAISGEVAIHRSSTVEPGAVVKGPAIIGPRCFIAAGAYLRDGVWLEADCIIGPGAELKTSFMFAGSKLAHFNFVGDSLIGRDVNLEAGSIVANYRNEREDKEIRVRTDVGLIATGITKFGAVLGDHSRIGANAVLAPGVLLLPHAIVRRGSVLDQEQDGAVI